MKREIIEQNIGYYCVINGFGDLAMDGELKYFIWNPETPLEIIQINKSGLVNLRYEKLYLNVPQKNIEFIGTYEEVLNYERS